MSGQANFLQSLGWAVLNSLWQLALLWIIYHVITGVTRNSKSSLKTSLASSLLIGGFAWFIYTFITAYINGGIDTIISSTFTGTEGNTDVNEWFQQSLPIASVLYLVLLVMPFLHFIRNYRYVQIIRRYGLTKINVDWRMFVKKMSAQMGITKKVQIWVSEFVSSPVTIGFLKPVILVPLAAINHLTPQQLEAVILHELSHIKRLDYLVNLIINFIQTILYFNPFVKALVKIVEREREKNCDEMVLQFQYDSHEYASALLMLEKTNHAEKILAIGAAGKKNDLLQRIELIMGVQKKPVISFNKLAGLMAGLICVIAINALLLFSRPADNNHAGTFDSLSSPFAFMEEQKPPVHIITEELPAIEQLSQIDTHTQKDNNNVVAVPTLATTISSAINNPYLINVNYESPVVPQLKKYEEAQVKEAMMASKKILESIQWKEIEKSIADVFSQQEKEQIKASYENEIKKMDWKKWETSLKQAYDDIDWENINTRLSAAVNQVRMDSIQVVYNKAISKLDGVSKELSQNNLKGIPDSDITLHELERKKADVLRALNELKVNRNKKIIHL
ncbi:MAG: M56 family metallopeptidase [Chitinophagaceae bacterium]|nr:M56 family metallopeptidase [Chitinophagaceae bacterium]